MAADRYLSVAREGWPLILAAGIAASLVQHYYGPSWAAPLWVGAVLVAFLFRDPERFLPGGALAVLSPADGVITAAETGQDPYLHREAAVIRLDMSMLGAYAVRSPVEGTVMQRWYEQPARNQGSRAGEHGIWLQTDEGDNVVLAVDSGTRLMPARCDLQPGERVGHGHRCGFVPFGARIEILLPANARVSVIPGQRVKAGVDALASFVHK